MADSSEKVSFLVDMQCSSLRAEAFLVFDKGSQPTLGRQSADKRRTVGRLLAEKAVNDSRPTVGRLSADCRPTVVRLSSDCRPTIVRLSSDCRPTVGQQSADSFLGELFFTFSQVFVIQINKIICVFLPHHRQLDRSERLC